MEISKETLKTVTDNVSKLMLLLAPGLAVFDFGLGRGFFSGGINTTLDFLLLLFWSAAFSFPYYVVAQLAMFWNEVASRADLEKMTEKVKTDPTVFETILIFIFFVLLLHYILFKLMVFWNCLAWIAVLGFAQRAAICIVSMFIALILGVPLSKLFYAICRGIVIMLGKRLLSTELKSKR